MTICPRCGRGERKMKIPEKVKLAHKIYLKIHPRIVELVDKFIKDNYNQATMYAFQIGIEGDIADVIGEKNEQRS